MRCPSTAAWWWGTPWAASWRRRGPRRSPRGSPAAGGWPPTARPTQPERIAGLGLVSSIGLTIHRGFRNFRPGLTRLLATAPVLSTLARPMITQGFRQAGFPPGISWPAMQHTLRCAAAIDFAENQAIYAAVRAPTLVAWTEDDALIEPEISQALAAAVPDGPRLCWPSGGHASVKTRAVELAAGLSEWLETL